MKIKLDAAFAQLADCPATKRKVDYWDTVTTGFVLEVRASGGKTYYLRYFDAKGRQRQLRIAGYNDVSFDQARKAAKRLRSEVVLGGDPLAAKQVKRAVPTYAVLAEQHIAHAKANQKAAFSTVGIIQNHLLPRFGRMRLDEITPRAVSEFLSGKRAEGFKPATIEKYRVTLGRSFSLGEQFGVPGCESNPVRGVRLPRFDNKRSRYLSADEAERLLQAAEASTNPQLRPIVALLLLTACRVSELLHAEWRHVDITRRAWLIRVTKNGTARHVPLSQAAVDVIERLPRFHGSPYLIPNPQTGAPFVTVKRAWATARKEAKLPDVRIHDLRHSAASFMINAGIDLYAVGKVLGHRDLKSTARYSHLSDRTLLAAVEAGAAQLGNTSQA